MNTPKEDLRTKRTKALIRKAFEEMYAKWTLNR